MEPQALCHIDAQKYYSLIEELSAGLLINFAQRPNYWDGMLGIADTLLDVYEIEQDNKYLEFATNLIINSSFYLNSNKLGKKEFNFVHQHFVEIMKGGKNETSI